MDVRGRIYHYTTPHSFCQEEICTKFSFVKIPNLCILPIAIRVQMWYTIRAVRGRPQEQKNFFKKVEKTS